MTQVRLPNLLLRSMWTDVRGYADLISGTSKATLRRIEAIIEEQARHRGLALESGERSIHSSGVLSEIFELHTDGNVAMRGWARDRDAR